MLYALSGYNKQFPGIYDFMSNNFVLRLQLCSADIGKILA